MYNSTDLKELLQNIREICGELDFPAEAADAMQNALLAVAGDREAAQCWQHWLTAYRRDIRLDYKAMIAETAQAAGVAGVQEYTAKLLIFLCLVQRLRELYVKRNLDLQIWHDSCMDLHWKLMECHKLYGIWGSFVSWWFPGFFDLTRFALGRLQFELVEFPEGYERAGKEKPDKMTKAVNVHIPSCGKLDREACQASYRQAALFFADAFPDGQVAFVCDSWLLFPKNRELLGENSGIVQFMSAYDVFGTREGNGDLWRVFNCADTKHLETLPEDTGLRRAYKNWLLAGNQVGSGIGIFFMQVPGR